MGDIASHSIGNEPASQPDDPAGLSERIAAIRFFLALANPVVVALDFVLPRLEQGTTTTLGLGASALFLLYATYLYLGLRRRLIPTVAYQRFSPFTDVAFAAVLIAATGGYTSPFNIWLVFAVVISGLSGLRWIPIAATLAALAAHSLIALIPQSLPIDSAVFAVRAGYLFGFAAVVAAIGAALARSSERLAILDGLGRRLANLADLEESIKVLKEELIRTVNPSRSSITIDESTYRLIESDKQFMAERVWRIRAGSRVMCTLELARNSQFTSDESHLVGAMLDRFASAVRRIKLSEELLDLAAREERLRFADELHDSYLQATAAITMHAEAARALADRNASPALEIELIARAAQEATRRARRFVDSQYDLRPVGGPESLRQILFDRWTGEFDISVSSDITLTEGQWRVVEAMLGEGLNNARAHGHANRVHLRITKYEGGVMAELCADGDSPAEQRGVGYGLTRLQRLASANGGSMSLGPGEHGGSALVVTFF